MGALGRLSFVASIAAALAACASPLGAGITPAATARATSPPATLPATSPPETGALEGRVTIGPLVPVEREGVPTPTAPPEAYTSRSIDIFQADGATPVTSVHFSPDGTYRVDLAPGTYVVKLARTGIDRAGSLPATITIRAVETVRLDIDIDTGIR